MTIRIRIQTMHKSDMSDPHRQRSLRDANGLHHDTNAVGTP